MLARCVLEVGPEGYLGRVNATNVWAACSSHYADTIKYPIAAIFTLFVDGEIKSIKTDERIPYDVNTSAWFSMSVWEFACSRPTCSSSTFQCGQTFGKPTESQDPSVATNAPSFNHNSSILVMREFTTNYLL